MTTTPFTTYAFLGTSRPVPRNMPDRVADVFNVKDYGALGNFSANDTAAIQAAFTAATNGGIIFFPPGGYNVTSGIDISCGAGGATRIIGASNATLISGDVPNGFIFYQLDNTNGPAEIANLTIQNNSLWIGSGALMLNNSSAYIHGCQFNGMISVLLPFNIYDVLIENCLGRPNKETVLGTGYNGTLGIAGDAPHIIGWRSTVGYQTAFQFWSSNGNVMLGNGIENCECAILLGSYTGWASHCTVSSDVLTVGGTLGSAEAQFGNGMQIYGRGLTLKTWGTAPMDFTTGTTIIGDHGTDPTLTGTGGAGTYRLNASFTISTPVPMWTRFNRASSAAVMSGLQSEGCHYILYFNQGGTSHISAVGGNTAVGEATDQQGTTGYMAKAGIYVGGLSCTTFSGCSGSNNTVLGCFYIDPLQESHNVTFESCTASKGSDNQITASISGDILTVTVVTSGTGLGLGMLLTGSGVTNCTIIGSVVNEPGTLTGFANTGTYRISVSQGTVTSRSMTGHYGPDWVMPTATNAKAGLRFINCGATINDGTTTGLNTLNMTFTCLPGQAGGPSSTNFPLVVGTEYFVVDGAKAGGGTAAVGDATQGGGTQHIKVWFNGTDWIRCG
jgi:hypothetical protein